MAQNEVQLVSREQRVTFSRETNAESGFAFRASVRNGKVWEPLLDGATPLIQGPHFNLIATRFEVVENQEHRKAIRLFGANTQWDYTWDALVEATKDSPLIRFVVTLQLKRDLPVMPGEPAAYLWTKKTTAPAVVVGQGPMSIYGGNNYGAGFPAAYLWQGQKEAAIFFNMTPMTWFPNSPVRRFLDSRAVAVSEEGRNGLGLRTYAANEWIIRVGEMVVEWFLYAGPRTVAPTRLQAQDRLVEIFAPLHPGEATLPPTRVKPFRTTWEEYARNGIETLMVRDRTFFEQERNWKDAPLNLVPPIEKMLIHPSHVGQTGGDFSTINNHLSPWLLFSRLHPTKERIAKFALRKRDALPAFFDEKNRFICWNPNGYGPLAMSWQTFWFSIETLRAAEVSGAASFNPAVAGRFLMGTRGLRELARNVGYNFPQWWNADTRQPAIQNDLPELGIIREPWQAGQYAYIMVRAFKMTDDRTYLDEARKAIGTLFRSLSYEVKNKSYSVRYTDPADFPITELFGNAYGAVAAYQIYERTKDSAYREYSRHFLTTLLHLTPWYEDEADPISRELKSLGLFYPHGGAYNLCPWETNEANLCLTWILRHWTDLPIRPLLLKLANLNRVNSFHFFPATWSESVRRHADNTRQDAPPYVPIEPFYTLEAPGGHRGEPALYKPTAMWNYWLYEALAEVNDPDILTLNLAALEGYEEAISGAERAFVVYNPGKTRKAVRFRLKHLPDGDYAASVKSGMGSVISQEGKAATMMANGIPLTLAPQASVEVTVRRKGAGLKEAIGKCRAAQNRLACAYQAIQDTAFLRGDTSGLLGEKAAFDTAMTDFRNGNYLLALKKAGEIITRLPGKKK